jgi:hypothetical protein
VTGCLAATSIDPAFMGLVLVGQFSTVVDSEQSCST